MNLRITKNHAAESDQEIGFQSRSAMPTAWQLS